ncbi:MAG: SEC-C metal-binding domain-containing protein [Planctomycetota bacterium]
MRAEYRVREIEYPAAAVVDYALKVGGSNTNEVYARIAAWASRKYSLNWTYEHFAGKNPQQIFAELKQVARDYLENRKFEDEIDRALQQHSGDGIVAWARQRFGTVLDGHPLDLDGDVREQLQGCAYEMCRYELTQLERYVLLNTLDAVWKDHMYAMDLLRHSIGLRGYAEKDPKIEYKQEGTRMFNEMLSNIRERVTDLIFKVQIAVMPEGGEGAGGGVAPTGPTAGGGPAGGMAYGNMQASHADATGAGFSTAAADQEAAMRKQGEGGAAQTIRRETPKVGRNDPCPCGSGKKYKQCHGKRN